MKIKHLLYLLLALPLVFAACNETAEETKKPKPVLTLTSEATLSFGAEGGQAEITYTLANAVEGTELTATCEANWVETVAGEKVNVVVAANDTEEARETKVVVTYGEQNFEVAVNQEAGVIKEYLFDENLVYAERNNLRLHDYTDNYIMITFYSDDETISFSTWFIVDEQESILSAGTYTPEAGNLLLDNFVLHDDTTDYWYSFFNSNGVAVVGGDINGYTFDFEITDNEGNNYHFTYEGVVEGMELPVNVIPTEPVNMTIENFEGRYYGNELSDAYHYYIYLSDLGLDNFGTMKPNGIYYQIGVYGIKGDIDDEGYIHIPAGTYTFDADDTKAEGTMNGEESRYFKNNADGTDYDGYSAFQGGQVVVTDDSITLTTTIGGVEHVVTYNGAPTVYVGFDEEEEETYDTTLTGDHTCTLDNHTLHYVYNGDLNGLGLLSWDCTLRPNYEGGENLQFSLMAAGDATDFAGTYTISATYNAYTSFMGMNIMGYRIGAWVFTDDQSIMAPMISGTLTITNNNDGTYSLTIDVTDDAKNKITGSWTGEAIEEA